MKFYLNSRFLHYKRYTGTVVLLVLSLIGYFIYIITSNNTSYFSETYNSNEQIKNSNLVSYQGVNMQPVEIINNEVNYEETENTVVNQEVLSSSINCDSFSQTVSYSAKDVAYGKLNAMCNSNSVETDMSSAISDSILSLPSDQEIEVSKKSIVRILKVTVPQSCLNIRPGNSSETGQFVVKNGNYYLKGTPTRAYDTAFYTPYDLSEPNEEGVAGPYYCATNPGEDEEGCISTVTSDSGEHSYKVGIFTKSSSDEELVINKNFKNREGKTLNIDLINQNLTNYASSKYLTPAEEFTDKSVAGCIDPKKAIRVTVEGDSVYTVNFVGEPAYSVEELVQMNPVWQWIECKIFGNTNYCVESFSAELEVSSFFGSEEYGEYAASPAYDQTLASLTPPGEEDSKMKIYCTAECEIIVDEAGSYKVPCYYNSSYQLQEYYYQSIFTTPDTYGSDAKNSQIFPTEKQTISKLIGAYIDDSQTIGKTCGVSGSFKVVYPKQEDNEVPPGEINCNPNVPDQEPVPGVDKEAFVSAMERVWGAEYTNAETCFNEVVCKARSSGVNPQMALLVWAHETGASAYGHPTFPDKVEDFGVHYFYDESRGIWRTTTEDEMNNFEFQSDIFMGLTFRGCAGYDPVKSWAYFYKSGDKCYPDAGEIFYRDLVKTWNFWQPEENGVEFPTWLKDSSRATNQSCGDGGSTNVNVSYNSGSTGNSSVSTANWWEYPDNISQIPSTSVTLTTIVSKSNRLASNYSPSGLTYLDEQDLGGITSEPGLLARKIILEDLKSMGDAATDDGINLEIVSAYRSYSTQATTFNYWVMTDGEIEAMKSSAKAGHSEHQLGTTLDFATYEGGRTRLWEDFDGTKADNWLAENAWQYGFYQSYPEGQEKVTRFKEESWHYRYIGRNNAKYCNDRNLVLIKCLEELNENTNL